MSKSTEYIIDAVKKDPDNVSSALDGWYHNIHSDERERPILGKVSGGVFSQVMPRLNESDATHILISQA
jgi:hypothetical protein